MFERGFTYLFLSTQLFNYKNYWCTVNHSSHSSVFIVIIENKTFRLSYPNKLKKKKAFILKIPFMIVTYKLASINIRILSKIKRSKLK